MKTFKNQFQATLSFFFVLIVLVSASSLNATTPQVMDMASQSGGGSVQLDLGQALSGEQTISVENLVPGESNWWNVSLSPDQQSIVFSSQDTSGPLPANAEAALITVSDPVNGISKTFVVGTDGGAILIVLGDF